MAEITEQIKCPSCNKAFTIDKASYAEILNQVRSKEFDREIHEKLAQFQVQHQSSLALQEEKAKKFLTGELAKKTLEITRLHNKIENFHHEKELIKKDVQATMQTQINELKDINTKLMRNFQEVENQNKLFLNDELAKKDLKIAGLQNKIENFNNEKELVKKDIQTTMQEQVSELKGINTRLRLKIQEIENQKQLEITKKLAGKESELAELNMKLTLQEKEMEIAKSTIKEKYDLQLKQKDEEVAFYKDFKAKQSTKILGESLEQHCEMEFNRLRMTAFPQAIFSKDNDAASGSKGDYIYCECDENGIEIISIMFEMKNEGDTTATKKKNEDFFAKLDKDRKDKKCEYAIMVSMLEQENELYNNGIVDVSYAYPKMYVIRPQFFIPMITLLRNAALKSLAYKNEVVLMKKQTIDVTNFEDKLNQFKQKFGTHYTHASTQFEKATKEIDHAIDHLQKIKEALRLTTVHLGRANNTAEDLTVKKLVRNNPTMEAKFQVLNESR